jgi:murein DD-endopeptidase MepM/ murein hydrolase activator NlpD
MRRRALGLVALVVTVTAFAAVVGSRGDSGARGRGVRVASLAPAGYPSPPRDAERDADRPSDDLHWPLHGEVTGGFGEARGGHMHEGVDIPMPEGTPIRAAANGTVVMRELQDGYGKYTCVAHVKITTCYGHQSRFRTKLGAKVEQGEVIGEVGATGNAPVTHLHFEVRRGTKPWGTPMNPLKFLPKPAA